MTHRALQLVFVLLSPTIVFSAPVAVESRVDEVTVYPGGATVTRVATVSLAAGGNDILLTGLVDDINAQSIRVEVMDDDVRIGQVSLANVQMRDVSDDEIASLQLELDAVTDKIRVMNDSTAAAKLQLTFLQGIASGYSKEAGTDGIRGAADVGSWQAALSLLLSASNDANQLIRGNDAKRKVLAKDQSVLQRRVNELRGGGLSSTQVELALHASRAVRAEIRLRYFLEDAFWRPQYEARLDSNSGALQLAQQANVYQETEEEWNNVKLTLSTSAPGGELMAPQLESKFLDLYKPQPRRRSERFSQGAVAADMNMAAKSSLEEVVVTGSKVRAAVAGFAVNYEIPGRSSVSNDTDDGVILDLASFSFNADLVTQVVPRQSTQAFLTARFIYDKALPLFGSEMTIYVDGAFAGNATMPTALPQTEIVLPMGQDRRIVVTAQTQGGEGGQGGIIARRQTEVTDYLFELTNRRSTASVVEVADLYPVARNKDIDVDVPSSATPPDVRDVDDRPGIILWKKTLAPGEAWRIKHQYSVSYPAKQRLTSQ